MDVRAVGLIAGLLRTARKQRSFSGLSKLLGEIARNCSAQGAILWRLRERQPSAGQYLYAASSYFLTTDEPVFMDLSKHCVSARALQTGQVEIELTLSRASPLESHLFSSLGVKRRIAVPIIESHGPFGILMLLDSGFGPYGGETVALSKAMAQMLPALTETLSEFVSNELIREVQDILGDLPGEPGQHSETERAAKNICAEVGRSIREAFDVLEYGIYLLPDGHPGSYIEQMAKHWPWTNREPRLKYREGEGTTGYCFSHGRSIIIEDLLTYHDNMASYAATYPGLVPLWSSREVGEAIQSCIAPHSITNSLPPVPLVALPIVEGRRTIGVLRICGTRTAPYYIDNAQLKCLGRIASTLAHWVGVRLRLDSIQELEFRSRTAVSQVRSLLEKSNFTTVNERSLSEALVKSLANFGRGVDIACYRQYALAGQNHTLTALSVHSKKRHTLPLPDAISFASAPAARCSPWAMAMLYGKFQYLPEPQGLIGDLAARVSLAIAPVSIRARPVEQERYGTLEIYSLDASGFSTNTIESLEMLADELAQLIRLSRAIRSEREIRDLREWETKVIREGLENLQHQLKTPVRLVKSRVDLVVKHALSQHKDLAEDLLEIQSSARRANQVVGNIEMYTAMARGDSLRLGDVELLSSRVLIARIEEACSLFEVDLPPKRGMEFRLHRDQLLVYDSVVVHADLSMLDQVVDILIENAVKYGDDHSLVEIGGGLINNRQFAYISIKNRGQEIPPHEVSRLKERGRRAERVADKSKGAGLGLYIAQEILEAHGGRLDVITTTKKGITEVRAVLPTGARI